MSYQLIHGNALHVSQYLEPNSVDTIISSPPYFALRSYRDDGEHFAGQLGSEATPGEFVDALIACTADWLKVLRPGGSLFVNLGDKYAGSGGHNNATLTRGNSTRVCPSCDRVFDSGRNKCHTCDVTTRFPPGARATTRNAPDRYNQASDGIRPKSLMGLPWRYAIRCIDELGLILRAEIIWEKVNGLPESVTDRVRRSHEQWFHFVREPRYFAAIDEVREEHKQETLADPRFGRTGVTPGGDIGAAGNGKGVEWKTTGGNPLGKVPSSVWTIEEELWNHVLTGPIRFCPRCGRDLTAGTGSAPRTKTDTASNGSPASDNGERIGSATNFTSDRSPTGSNSITSVETVDASDRTTSSRSPAGSTSCEVTPLPPGTQPRLTATTGTSSPKPTPTSGHEVPESAACVCEIVRVPTGGGSVWPVPSEPLVVPDHLGVDHFAAFPTEWPRRLILGWSPSGYCTACDEPRQAIVDKALDTDGVLNGRKRDDVSTGRGKVRDLAEPDGHTGGWNREGYTVGSTVATITGYRCACPDTTAPTRPSVVLDPFAGTGTVPMVAHHLGRHGIGIDLSKDYLRLAEWRCSSDVRARSKVRTRTGIPDPVPAAPGQLDLFDDGVAS